MNTSTIFALVIILFFILPAGRPALGIIGLAIALYMALKVIG